MHLVYIDEVKWDGRQEQYYWLCALAIPEQEILAAEESLNDIATRFFGDATLSAETEFHATKIVQGKWPFAGRDRGSRLALFKELTAVISDRAEILRAVVRLDPKRMMRDDLQSIAFMFLVEKIDALMRRRKSLALLIADHDKEFVNSNVHSLSSYRARGTNFALGRPIKHVVDTVHHTHSHHSRLIQLADVYAYSKSFCEKEHTKEPNVQLLAHLRGLPNFLWPSTFKDWPPEP